MNDLISRQGAIKELEYMSANYTGQGEREWHPHIREVQDVIRLIPSAKPERKKGRWQWRKGSDCWECSECHAVLESDDIVRHNFYYCYHCGTDMMNEDGYMKLEGTEHE